MGKSLLQTVAPVALGLGAMALTGGAAAPAVAGAVEGGAAAGAGAGAGLGAFGSADMIATGAGGGLLGGTGAASAAGAAAGSAAPSSIESAGLLDMGGGNLVNPEYFVGEGMGMPMYAGSPDAPFAERAGNVMSSLGDKMNFDPSKAMKMMNMGQPQQQQPPMGGAPMRPQSQPAMQSQAPYSQPISGSVQLTDEQKAMLLQRMQMGGLLNG